MLDFQQRKLLVAGTIVNTENSSMFMMGTDRLLDIMTSRPSTESSVDIDYDLEALVDQYADDYQTLSAGFFTESFRSNKRQNVGKTI